MFLSLPITIPKVNSKFQFEAILWIQFSIFSNPNSKTFHIISFCATAEATTTSLHIEVTSQYLKWLQLIHHTNKSVKNIQIANRIINHLNYPRDVDHLTTIDDGNQIYTKNLPAVVTSIQFINKESHNLDGPDQFDASVSNLTNPQIPTNADTKS